MYKVSLCSAHYTLRMIYILTLRPRKGHVTWGQLVNLSLWEHHMYTYVSTSISRCVSTGGSRWCCHFCSSMVSSKVIGKKSSWCLNATLLTFVTSLMAFLPELRTTSVKIVYDLVRPYPMPFILHVSSLLRFFISLGGGTVIRPSVGTKLAQTPVGGRVKMQCFNPRTDGVWANFVPTFLRRRGFRTYITPFEYCFFPPNLYTKLLSQFKTHLDGAVEINIYITFDDTHFLTLYLWDWTYLLIACKNNQLISCWLN